MPRRKILFSTIKDIVKDKMNSREFFSALPDPLLVDIGRTWFWRLCEDPMGHGRLFGF